MSDEESGLSFLGGSMIDVQLKWTLGLMAETLGVSRKDLRKAYWIVKQPQFEAEIPEKGKMVKRIFTYGFHYFVTEKKGKKRDILAPHPTVQLVFKAIKNWLEKNNQPHKNEFGFTKGRGTKKAVIRLRKEKYFFRFDIADAFPSIISEMVEKSLRKLKVEEALIAPLVWLTTYHYNSFRRLPQGASSSPTILNFVYKPMCQEVERVCQKYHIKWIVYADDFNFAGNDITPEMKEELLAIPPKYGFKVKPEKTKDNAGKTIPHVLGLTVVDANVHLKHQMKNKARRIFYAARKFGSYSTNQVEGMASYISSIYGSRANWPRWVLKEYLKYQWRQMPGFDEIMKKPGEFDAMLDEHSSYLEGRKKKK